MESGFRYIVTNGCIKHWPPKHLALKPIRQFVNRILACSIKQSKMSCSLVEITPTFLHVATGNFKTELTRYYSYSSSSLFTCTREAEAPPKVATCYGQRTHGRRAAGFSGTSTSRSCYWTGPEPSAEAARPQTLRTAHMVVYDNLTLWHAMRDGG